VSLVLASASPRRLDLLRQIGVIPNEIVPPVVDETPAPGEGPQAFARRMAVEKCQSVRGDHPDSWVLAADTVVSVGRRILGKAADEDQARAYLELLSGRRHSVVGAIAVGVPGSEIRSRVIKTAVSFKQLHSAEIKDYLRSGEWRDKAGAYAIQGRAAVFVRQLNGSYSNVVGLSLFDVSNLLSGTGWRPDVAGG